MSGRKIDRGRGSRSIPSHPRGRGRAADLFSSQTEGRSGAGRGRGTPSLPVVFRPEKSQLLKYNANVKSTEEEIVKLLKPNTDGPSPVRPGFGTKGREILLWTNYFELIGYGNLALYRYNISIAPARSGIEVGTKKKRRLVQILLEDHFRQHNDIISDFGSTLLSKYELNLQDQYEVIYSEDGRRDLEANGPVYQIKLDPTGLLSCSELLEYVTSTNSNALLSSRNELIQALNIIVGYYPKAASNISSIGANKHYGLGSSSDKVNIGSGLQAIRGFFVSVRAATARVLVNVQVKHGSFYEEGPLVGLITVFMRDNGPNKSNLEAFVRGLSVRVTHIQRKDRNGRTIPRIKRIFGLATTQDGPEQSNPPIVPEFGAGPTDVKFFWSEMNPGTKKKKQEARKATSISDRYISVFDFFKQAYSLVIQNVHLPVVNVGTRTNPSYLPAQVCEVIAGQHSSAKVTPSQTQNMIRFAVRKPEQNARSIVTSGASLIGFEPTNTTLHRFGLQVKPELVCVPGRVLDHPVVRYHGSNIVNVRFGSWNLQSVKLSTSTELPYWTYLALSMNGNPAPWRSEQVLRNALGDFTQKLKDVGITTAAFTPGMTVILHIPSMESQIDHAIHTFMHSEKRKPPRFILVILPYHETKIYNRVKYACDIKEGVLNVCTIASKFVKPHNDQYFANIALKVNLKLGGRNHTLDDHKLGIVSEGKTMIVGLDVTHPSPGSAKTAPSVGGIVASIDHWLAQWPAELIILPPRQEMITGLQPCLKSRLALWQKHNKSLPENILIYRDGVSEGQYHLILQHELPAFRTACEEMYPATMTRNGFPHITIIVVGKRHNTRFYPTRTEDADRSSNPPNGTVVDRGVTEARNWDFFLQAHTALQGTARPAHYYVILDDIFRKGQIKPPFSNAADVLEDLTHNLCYLFGRATKAVSICPPAYYADLVCERARCYLSNVFDPETIGEGSVSTVSNEVPDSSMIRLHSNVENSMFYI